MPQDYNASVVKNEKLSDTLILLTVKPDFPIATFKAGQFTTVGLKLGDKLVKKAYSIASSPAQNQYLEFYVALVPGGELTPHLFALKSEDRLFVGEKITGKFTLDNVEANKHVLLICTGTGLAPFLSMIRTHLICGGDRHFVILHGARHSAELSFYAELCVQAKNCKNFHYIPAVSRPGEDPYWGGPKGRVTDVITTGIIETTSGLALSPDNFDVLLCGNPAMIADMITYLKTRGFLEKTATQKGQIHVEKYW